MGRTYKWTWATLVTDLRKACTYDPNTSCHLWPHATDKDGYPKIMIEGRQWRGNRAVAHAVTGTIGPMALHSCHRPSCLNPEHIRWGTAKDNARDMWNAGRSSSNLKAQPGSKNGRSKLTDDQRAAVIRRRLAGEKRADLAAEYGVNEVTISATVRNAGIRIPVGRPPRTRPTGGQP